MQAPELIPIKVNEALELIGIDLIGKYKQELKYGRQLALRCHVT